MSRYDGYDPYVEDDTIALTHQGYSMLLVNKDRRVAQLEADLVKLKASLGRYKDAAHKFYVSCAPDCGCVSYPGLRQGLELYEAARLWERKDDEEVEQ
jgi:hypothetical protein